MQAYDGSASEADQCSGAHSEQGVFPSAKLRLARDHVGESIHVSHPL